MDKGTMKENTHFYTYDPKKKNCCCNDFNSIHIQFTFFTYLGTFAKFEASTHNWHKLTSPHFLCSNIY